MENGSADGGLFHSGEKTTITAKDRKNEGLVFDRWEMVSGEGSFENAKSETTVFTVGSKDADIQAVYVQGYRLTVENGMGSGVYRAGVTVPLTAELEGKGEFVAWALNGQTGKIEDPLALSTNFIMGEGDAVVRPLTFQGQSPGILW